MSDTLAGLLQVGRTRRRPGCLLEATGRLHGPHLHHHQGPARRARRLPRHRRGQLRRPALARLREGGPRVLGDRRRPALPPAAGAVPPAAVAGLPGRSSGSRLQHRLLLPDQHELAGVLRRVDDGPPRADGRAGGAELRLRRRRHRRRGRADPGLLAWTHRPDRQLLGRPGPRDLPGPAADRLRRGRGARGHGGDPELLLRDRRVDPGRPPPDPDRRTRGLAGGDQGAGHERRRLLQRQLGPPLREPQPVEQPLRDLPAPGDPRRPDPHVRHDGRRPSTGLRAARRDGRALARSAGGGDDAGDAPPRSSRPGGRRVDGGQGDAVRRTRVVALRRVHHGYVDRRGRTRSTRRTAGSPEVC